MKNVNKILVVALVVCMLAMAAMGATLAWLIDTDNEAVNTFTIGAKVEIELTESDDLDLAIVPGKAITKDPKVTVAANSEDCFVFVKITGDLPKYEAGVTEGFTWSVASEWTKLDGYENVWYKEYAKTNADQNTYVLTDNKVTVSSQYNMKTTGVDDVNKVMTISAYAIQADYIADSDNDPATTAAQAWTALTTQYAAAATGAVTTP